MSSPQQKFLAKTGIRGDSLSKRHASPSSSVRSLPRSPLSETFSSVHIAQLAKKGVRNILHSRAKSDDQTQASASSRSTASYPGPASDTQSSAASPTSVTAAHNRRRSVKSLTLPESGLPSRPPPMGRSSSNMSASFQISLSPDTMSEGTASRPISLQSADLPLGLAQVKQKGSSKNARLQRILADKDLVNIIVDTSSLPSTTISTAKSTGMSMAPSSASSLGDFLPPNESETSYRMATALPGVPLDSKLNSTAPTTSEAEQKATGGTITREESGSTERSIAEQIDDLKAWNVCSYQSGDIKTDHTFGLYAIPFMTAMDVLCQSTAVNDEQVVDDMIDYFASLGLEPTVNTLDTFWKANDIPTPISPPPKTSPRKQNQSHNRASRHSPAGRHSHLTVPSPHSLQPSALPDIGSISPLLSNNTTDRFSASQHSTSSTDHPGSSPRDSQRSSSRNRSSPQISPHWVLAHRDTSATAFLAIPARPLSTAQQQSLVGQQQQQQQQSQASSCPTSNASFLHAHYQNQGQGQAQAQGPSEMLLEPQQRLAKSPNRAGEFAADAGAVGTLGGHGTVRGRFSIRKILSRHSVLN